MKYLVRGGRYDDIELSCITKLEEYGPFQTYEDAMSMWKKKSFEYFDDHFTRYTISEVE